MVVYYVRATQLLSYAKFAKVMPSRGIPAGDNIIFLPVIRSFPLWAHAYAEATAGGRSHAYATQRFSPASFGRQAGPALRFQAHAFAKASAGKLDPIPACHPKAMRAGRQAC